MGFFGASDGQTINEFWNLPVTLYAPLQQDSGNLALLDGNTLVAHLSFLHDTTSDDLVLWIGKEETINFLKALGSQQTMLLSY